MKVIFCFFNGAVRRAAAFAVCLVLLPVAVANEPLTYHSEEVGCDWLDAEYASMKFYADPNRPKSSGAPTAAGVMMTFAMILSLPVLIFKEAFGKRQKFDFSRDPDDLSIAAANKNCSALLELIARDKESGKYPPPRQRNDG